MVGVEEGEGGLWRRKAGVDGEKEGSGRGRLKEGRKQGERGLGERGGVV